MAIDTKSVSQLIAEFRKLQAKDAIIAGVFGLHHVAARRPARHCRYFRNGRQVAEVTRRLQVSRLLLLIFIPHGCASDIFDIRLLAYL